MKIKHAEIREEGFTLVEIMVALVMSAIIVAAIYSAYTVQNIMAIRQSQVADVQANLRVVAYSIVKEIRMAGFDPTESDKPSITVATPTTITFTVDVNANGFLKENNGTGTKFEPNEKITYSWNSTNSTITRKVGDLGTPQPMANDIIGFELLYFVNDTTGGHLTLAPNTTELDDIRSVTVSMLAAAHQDPAFTDRSDADSIYVSCSKSLATCQPAYNRKSKNFITSFSGGTSSWPNSLQAGNLPHQRKRMLVTTVNCRNMGL